jgi:hypothetical protein
MGARRKCIGIEPLSSEAPEVDCRCIDAEVWRHAGMALWS